MKTLKVKDKLWVHWQGRLYSLPLEEASSRKQSEDAADLIAPFSCKVLKVFVKPGQSVKKGEPVVVVEAMKMEYSYSSPRDGTIEAVLVSEGQIVSDGAHFVRWSEK